MRVGRGHACTLGESRHEAPIADRQRRDIAGRWPAAAPPARWRPARRGGPAHAPDRRATPRTSSLDDPPRGPRAQRPLGRRHAPARRGVRARGRPTTVVLAHGWTETLQYWIYVIRASDGARLPGRRLRPARTRRAASPPTAATTRSSASARISRRCSTACVPDASRAVVAGHSLGAMSIAAWAGHARRASGAPRAALLLNTGVGDLIAEQLLLPLPGIAQGGQPDARAARLPRQQDAAAARLDAAQLRGDPLRRVRPDTPPPRRWRSSSGCSSACPPDVRADIGIAMSEMDLHHALPHLTVPTIVIAGADDRLTPPSHARRIAEMLPAARSAARAARNRPHDAARAAGGGDRRPGRAGRR